MTAPTPSLRPATPADYPAMLALWLAASRQAHAFLGDAHLTADAQRVAEQYLPLAENWVSVDGDTVLGFIGLLPGGFVGGLFVDPAQQGRGIGRQLIDHAQTLHGPLSLTVYAENTGALAFYQRLGFEETGREPTDDDGRPHGVVRLVRAVAP